MKGEIARWEEQATELEKMMKEVVEKEKLKKALWGEKGVWEERTMIWKRVQEVVYRRYTRHAEH